MNEQRGYTKSLFTMMGATGHFKDERAENDFYATPPEATEMLLQLENFSKNIWEPACGMGHIVKVLENKNYHVKCTDLVYRGIGQGNVDFLKCNELFDGDIITNPPYKYAKEFVEKALELVENGHKVAMFLKLQFLEGKARRELFKAYPPPVCLCKFIAS